MSVRFVKQYFSFNKIQEKHEDLASPNRSYVRFSLSSSRKRTDTGEREYSDWFATARGDVAKFVDGLVKGDFLVCTGAFERVPYKTADGAKKWPDAQVIMFEMTKYVRPEDTVVPEAVVVDEPSATIPTPSFGTSNDFPF